MPRSCTRVYKELLFNRQTKCHTGTLICHLETERLDCIPVIWTIDNSIVMFSHPIKNN